MGSSSIFFYLKSLVLFDILHLSRKDIQHCFIKLCVQFYIYCEAVLFQEEFTSKQEQIQI